LVSLLKKSIQGKGAGSGENERSQTREIQKVDFVSDRSELRAGGVQVVEALVP
jgi:hypothetical protein